MIKRLVMRLMKRGRSKGAEQGQTPVSNGSSAGHYDAEYFEKQKVVGEFGGKANLFKFEEFIRPDMTVLDFGCGGGYLLKKINCSRKIGIEINPAAREEAEKNGIEVYGDLEDVPEQICDLIISNHALEHVENPCDTLRIIRKKLKPGGKCVFVVPYEKNGEKWRIGDESMHLYTWSPRNIGNLLTVAGFEVEKVETIEHAWPSNYRELLQKKGWAAFHRECRREAKRQRIQQVRVVGRVGDPSESFAFRRTSCGIGEQREDREI